MTASRTTRAKKAGLPPGSLIHTGKSRSEPVSVHLLDYDPTGFREMRVQAVEECYPSWEQANVAWIDIDGLHQVEYIKKLEAAFGVHPLVQEDILNVDQRPKFEDHGSYLYGVVQMLTYDDRNHRIRGEQLSLLLGTNYLISIQEKPGDDVLEPIRERLRSGRGRIRRMGADYLLYALLDAVVDGYFVVLERFGDDVDLLESKALVHSQKEMLRRIQHAKRDIHLLRRALWPLRELVGSLQKSESELLKEETGIYFKDIADHVLQLVDEVEVFRETIADLRHIYLSNLSNQLNEVMKVLTVFAAIFIPLTFIVGVYGMNFKHMPELQWPWAYPLLWLIMLGVGGGLFYYFYRKKWW